MRKTKKTARKLQLSSGTVQGLRRGTHHAYYSKSPENCKPQFGQEGRCSLYGPGLDSGLRRSGLSDNCADACH